MKQSKTWAMKMALTTAAFLVAATVALADEAKGPQHQHQQPTTTEDRAPGMGAMDNMGSDKSMPGMGGMSDMGGMEGKANMPMTGDAAKHGPAAMKTMEMRRMGMEMMGRMAGSASQQSPLPGFPGASHLYHVGSTDYFLDHVEAIGLDVEQRRRLGQIREQAQMEGATFERQVMEAEQDLWQLTAADQPEIDAIEAKVREIETLRGNKRISFIRSVGAAAEVLTTAQRQQLVGAADPGS